MVRFTDGGPHSGDFAWLVDMSSRLGVSRSRLIGLLIRLVRQWRRSDYVEATLRELAEETPRKGSQGRPKKVKGDVDGEVGNPADQN